jgi:hypothetical protein
LLKPEAEAEARTDSRTGLHDSSPPSPPAAQEPAPEPLEEAEVASLPEPRPVPDGGPSPPPLPPPPVRSGSGGAAGFAYGVAAAAVFFALLQPFLAFRPAPPPQRTAAETLPRSAPPASREARFGRTPATTFVAARRLNCRAAPDERAEPVRRLSRGEPLDVLAWEPGWASIARGGGQCWVSGRYISEVEPW